MQVTQLAVEARLRTRGRFDPTVHDALVAAGYDRTFEELQGRVAETTAPPRCGGRIAVDPRTGLIELEPGFRLDLGGIAKGYAVDRLCDMLGAAGPCLVDAGGDIAVCGGSWPVGVETADGVLTLQLARRRRRHIRNRPALLVERRQAPLITSSIRQPDGLPIGTCCV